MKYTDPDGEFIFTLLAAVIPGAQFLLPYAIAADISWMTDYAIQAATNYLTNPSGSPEEWFLKHIDFLDLGVSAIAGAATHGISNLNEATKAYKALDKVINYGLPALSARYDWKPFSDDRKWNVNRGIDFWAPYAFAAVKQKTATNTSNRIVDELYSNQEYLLNNPKKGHLLKELLDVPASIFSGWLSNEIITPEEKKDQPIPKLPKETPLPPNWWEKYNYKKQSNLDIKNSLTLYRF